MRSAVWNSNKLHSHRMYGDQHRRYATHSPYYGPSRRGRAKDDSAQSAQQSY